MKLRCVVMDNILTLLPYIHDSTVPKPAFYGESYSIQASALTSSDLIPAMLSLLRTEKKKSCC